MALQKPEEERSIVGQVLSLANQLTPDELAEVRRKLNAKAWGQEWRALCKEVDEHNKGKLQLSDEEIAAEVKAVREEMKAERARQSGN
jgi:hypothetical protein